MTSAEHLRAWALHLAERGWPVFPLTPAGKRPRGHCAAHCQGGGRCSGGHQTFEQYASTDPELIHQAWTAGPWNIGIATGPARLVVIDLDTAKHPGDPDGADTLAAALAEREVTLPDTFTVSTPSGGTHHYYRTPAGVHLRNTASVLAARVDTRAEGGYIVGPGSRLPTGGYELVDDQDPAELPAWAVQVLTERPTVTEAGGPVRDSTRYGAAALTAELDRIRTAQPGEHNRVLSTAAFHAGQLIRSGHLDHRSTRDHLSAAARHLITAHCECTKSEVDRVITAGLGAGQHHPRRLQQKGPH